MNLDFLYLRSVQMFSSQLVSCFWREVWVATSVWAEISLGNPGERQIIFYIQQELQIICHIKLLWGDLFDWHEFKAATTRQTSTKYSVIVTVIVCFWRPRKKHHFFWALHKWGGEGPAQIWHFFKSEKVAQIACRGVGTGHWAGVI